jgi:hypothetical protein
VRFEQTFTVRRMKAPPGLGTLFTLIAARQFRGYHENLRRELERP